MKRSDFIQTVAITVTMSIIVAFVWHDYHNVTPPFAPAPTPHVDPVPTPAPNPAPNPPLVNPSPAPEPPHSVVVVPVEPEWIEWKAVRGLYNVKDGKVFNDVYSHVRNFQWYDNMNRETTTHENTHELNADVRRKYGNNGSYQGVYCLQGRALAWPNPKVSAQAALKGVEKGNIVSWPTLREWDNDGQPLYVFDELTAYTNGLQCLLELNIEPAQKNTDLSAIVELQRYCQAIINYIPAHDSDYKYTKNLQVYLDWNKRLVDSLKAGPPDSSNVGPNNDLIADGLRFNIKEDYIVCHMVPGGSGEWKPNHNTIPLPILPPLILSRPSIVMPHGGGR